MANKKSVEVVGSVSVRCTGPKAGHPSIPELSAVVQSCKDGSTIVICAHSHRDSTKCYAPGSKIGEDSPSTDSWYTNCPYKR